MKRFRRLFAFLFILSLFVGVFHELSHDHHHDESCEVCLISHVPLILDSGVILCTIQTRFEPFSPISIPRIIPSIISLCTRSPPLS